MDKHMSEISPKLRLVVDEGPPPPGVRVWCVSMYGVGFASSYHPEYAIVAWCPLPKFTPEQKARMKALETAGIELTQKLEISR